ncbi:MAG TPA: fructoselysine 6-kinase [Bacillota bacterium]|nr:fructoselysine 6-kinase [Bacillota bacterium]
MIKLACVGDNCVDFYDETQEIFFGGNPVNVAVYAKRLGADSSYIGAVGNDSFGAEMLKAISAKGVDTSHTRILPGATALTHVSRVDGDRVFGDYDEGVMADFRMSDKDIDFICSHDIMVSGLWGHTASELDRLNAKVPIAFDFSDRPDGPEAEAALPYTDIAFFSDDDSETEALKKKMSDLAERGPETVVATRGAKGSLALSAGRFYEQEALLCELVDTMGAGDSFIAAFLIAFVRGEDIALCMKAGAESAAFTISYPGAW